MDKKIFVVGAPRSGTSYLARALSLAEEVAYFEESGVFSLYGARSFSSTFSEIIGDVDVFEYNAIKHKMLRVTDRLRGVDRLDHMTHRMLLHTKLQPYDLEPSRPLIEIQQCRLTDEDLSLQKTLVEKYEAIIREVDAKAMFAAFFDDFVRLSGKKHLLEKTPDHIGFVPVIRDVFPDAKIILIRRDKKDSIASLVKHFDARTTLQNRLLTDRMLLKKQCKVFLYYEKIEEWLAAQPWCYTISYKQMVEKPYETICDTLEWAGLMIDETRYRPLFIAGTPSSNWDQLSPVEQRVLEDL